MPFQPQLKLVALTCTTLVCNLALAQPSLDELRSRRTSLQEELSQLDKQITEQEQAQRQAETKTPRPTHFVSAFGIDEIDSAGGVSPYVTVLNPDPKGTIKYIRVRLTPFNAVGDAVTSSVGQRGSADLQYTGPLEAIHEDQRTVWRPIWYNSTVDCLRVDSVTVVYVDGRTKRFIGSSLKQALAPGLKNDCSYRRK